MFKKSVSFLALAALLGSMSVSAAFAATDSEISSSVRKQISAADSEPFSHARVNVSSKDGTVYLRGSVDNIALISQFENLAAMTEGVSQVVNEISFNAPN